MPAENRPRPPTKLAQGKFELNKKLGAGCFGEVYRGTNMETKVDVAIKTEYLNSGAPQLEHEAETLNVLRNPVQPQGFAEYFYFGREGAFNCLVMELLGKSLEENMQKCDNKFTVKTTVLIAEQVLHRIEYLHSKGIVHRDIKPENFMFGVKGRLHHIYLIDFGLSKRYWDKKHAQMKQKLSLTGTARYASINAHRGVEQSRRDDLEAIGHMFMYFLRGSLPWSGLEAKTKQEKYRKICERKEHVPLAELCAGFPDAFEVYLHCARTLGFFEKPDYTMLFNLFRSVREKEAEGKRGPPIQDHHFQWLEGKELEFPLVPLAPRQRLLQPDDPDERRTGGPRFRCCFCGGKGQVKE